MTTFERLYAVIELVFRAMNREGLPPIENLSEHSLLKEDVGLDSLAFVMTMLEIEREFSVSLEADSMSACVCVGDVIAIIENSTRG